MGGKGHNDPFDKEVGLMLRNHRIAAGLSQEKVGEHLGITFQQIQKYEKGTNRISSGRLRRLAALFGVPIAEFFPNIRANGHDTFNNPIFALADSKDAVQLLTIYNTLPLKHRSLVRQFADTLAQANAS